MSLLFCDAWQRADSILHFNSCLANLAPPKVFLETLCASMSDNNRAPTPLELLAKYATSVLGVSTLVQIIDLLQ